VFQGKYVQTQRTLPLQILGLAVTHLFVAVVADEVLLHLAYDASSCLLIAVLHTVVD